MPLEAPILSLADPVADSEGSIDPLGLMPTYERLAERIYPFITVRMSRPRFLTAIVVGAHVCSDFGEDLAKDGITPAWLVFEWHVVEALVRSRRGTYGSERTGVPGGNKVQTAIDRGRRVSHGTYLKTAKVFGFTGVYRRLASGLQLVDDDLRLDAGGMDLLRTWEKERGLDGFLSGRSGEGSRFREQLRDLVRSGMQRGHAGLPSRGPLRDSIAAHLAPDGAGRREKDWIADRLKRSDLKQNPGDPCATEVRQELIRHLESRRKSVPLEDERAFFASCRKDGSSALRGRLSLIETYEKVCRPLSDVFDLIRHLADRGRSGTVSPDDFSKEGLSRNTARQLGSALARLAKAFDKGGDRTEVEALLDHYSQVSTPRDLFDALLLHHEAVQKRKPPDGKRPWIEGPRGETISVRLQYVRPEEPDSYGGYVHNYRTPSVSRFLQELGRIRE